MSEPLIGAVDAATVLGITTVVAQQGSRIELPSGSNIPLDTSTGVTRCKNLVLYDPSVHGTNPRIHGTTLPPSVADSPVRTVTAHAATLVDSVRMRGSASTSDDLFASWTKRCCGLAPEAVAHLSANSVGCNAPAHVPSKYKDLKWWPSALAGKMRASSHPPREDNGATRFRQVVAMDFLEFSVNGRKFHAHAFLDYHSTHAIAIVTRSRSTQATAPAY